MKTTPEQFEQFKEQYKYYVELFGLKGWDIRYKMNTRDGCDAWMSISDLEDRIATANLNKKLSSADMKTSFLAKHESLELLFARIDYLAKCRHVTEREIDEERHNIIGILERIIP